MIATTPFFLHMKLLTELDLTYDTNFQNSKVFNITVNFLFFYDKLFTEINKTKRFLKEDPNLIVLRADNGNVTVVINRDDYNNKINDTLSDNTTYMTFPTNPIVSIQNKTNKQIKELYNNKYIDLLTQISHIT